MVGRHAESLDGDTRGRGARARSATTRSLPTPSSCMGMIEQIRRGFRLHGSWTWPHCLLSLSRLSIVLRLLRRRSFCPCTYSSQTTSRRSLGRSPSVRGPRRSAGLATIDGEVLLIGATEVRIVAVVALVGEVGRPGPQHAAPRRHSGGRRHGTGASLAPSAR